MNRLVRFARWLATKAQNAYYFWVAVRTTYDAQQATRQPSVKTHAKGEARRLTVEDVDGWLEAADSRPPEAVRQLEQFINSLAEEYPMRGARVKVDFAWVLKQADKRHVRWNRG